MTSGTCRVLVVDNEPQICALVREELSEAGFTCCTTTRSEQAKDLLGQHDFRVMLADITMPHISGLDLLAYAKRHAPDCKVILFTGASKREYLAQALMLGADDYIEKPFRPGELVEIVSRASSGRGDLPSLSVRAAEAMELRREAKRASLDSVRALVRAVEAKDPYTRRHSEQVAHYATALAGFLHLPNAAVESIRVASLLHDVGKIGVPDHILTKPGPLTEEEFAHIRRHPALGAEILANVTMFGAEARIVRHHHERWDGSGYPDGLAGTAISLAARIINLADSIDAMLMDRTYKKGYPVATMLAELVRCAGTQFDPDLASAAVRWCRSNPHELIVPNTAVELAS